MEPLGCVGVGVDARIVSRKRLHLVEAMLDWIGLGLVTEMPFARKVRGVAVFLKEFSDCWRLFFERIFVARGHNYRECRADRNASCNERSATGRATCLAIPVRERCALLS